MPSLLPSFSPISQAASSSSSVLSFRALEPFLNRPRPLHHSWYVQPCTRRLGSFRRARKIATCPHSCSRIARRVCLDSLELMVTVTVMRLCFPGSPTNVTSSLQPGRVEREAHCLPSHVLTLFITPRWDDDLRAGAKCAAATCISEIASARAYAVRGSVGRCSSTSHYMYIVGDARQPAPGRGRVKKHSHFHPQVRQ